MASRPPRDFDIPDNATQPPIEASAPPGCRPAQRTSILQARSLAAGTRSGVACYYLHLAFVTLHPPLYTLLLKHLLDLRLQQLLVEGANVLIVNCTVLSDKEGLRHTVDTVVDRDLPLEVRTVWEAELEPIDDRLPVELLQAVTAPVEHGQSERWRLTPDQR